MIAVAIGLALLRLIAYLGRSKRRFEHITRLALLGVLIARRYTEPPKVFYVTRLRLGIPLAIAYDDDYALGAILATSLLPYGVITAFRLPLLGVYVYSLMLIVALASRLEAFGVGLERREQLILALAITPFRRVDKTLMAALAIGVMAYWVYIKTAIGKSFERLVTRRL